MGVLFSREQNYEVPTADTCLQCAADVTDISYFTLPVCHHVFCYKCMVEYLKEFTSADVKCLNNKCRKNIPGDIIRQCLSNDQLLVYDYFEISKCSSNIFRCLTKECINYVILEGKDVRFDCSYCRSPNCSKCKKRHYHNQCRHNSVESNEIENEARYSINNKKRENLLNKYPLISNFESFTCSICQTLILPRVGVILNNCLHCFCKSCLENHIKNKRFISKMNCPECTEPLEPGEISSLMGEEDLAKMIIQEASFLFSQCYNGDCSGMVDNISKGDSFTCPECGQANCVRCQDIHTGMTCEEFRKTRRYVSPEEIEMVINTENVSCFSCKKTLIKNGGCNALCCDNCGKETCLFTGKIAGIHKEELCHCRYVENCSKIDLYCGCKSTALCDQNCKEGCFRDEK